MPDGKEGGDCEKDEGLVCHHVADDGGLSAEVIACMGENASLRNDCHHEPCPRQGRMNSGEPKCQGEHEKQDVQDMKIDVIKEGFYAREGTYLRWVLLTEPIEL